MHFKVIERNEKEKVSIEDFIRGLVFRVLDNGFCNCLSETVRFSSLTFKSTSRPETRIKKPIKTVYGKLKGVTRFQSDLFFENHVESGENVFTISGITENMLGYDNIPALKDAVIVCEKIFTQPIEFKNVKIRYVVLDAKTRSSKIVHASYGDVILQTKQLKTKT